MSEQDPNIVWHPESVTKEEKEKLLGQKGRCFWFTGLSGSGKSTLASALARKWHDAGKYTILLDGDNIRHGLCSDLGFSDEDRTENIRRIAEVVKLGVENGALVLTAFISPFIKDRQKAREIVGKDQFTEIFVDCAIEECAKRDPKGLYGKAGKGEIKNFTGLGSDYEPPQNPDIHLVTTKTPLEQSVQGLLEKLQV